jgi:uncharacterized protein
MDFSKYNTAASPAAVQYNVGLRQYMLQVFNLMSLALLVTGIMAYYASSEAFMNLIMVRSETGASLNMLGIIIQFAPLAMVLFLSFKIQTMSAQAAKIAFWSYAVLMGLSFGQIFYVYSGESIARTFFTTASVFGAMSIYGYSTKKDLTSFGSFLMMGVMGILIASIINMFMGSAAISFAVSIIGVLVFTGLTAYDVQKIKNLYFYSAGADKDQATKLAIFGALTLYIDFINLFIMLLRFFGESRRN